MLSFLWRATRGYRLRPWRSPYLRWRIETYWGIPAEDIGFRGFWRLVWERRADLLRFLRWARRMQVLFGCVLLVLAPALLAAQPAIRNHIDRL